MSEEKTTDGCKRTLLMKSFIAILLCSLSIYLLPGAASSGNKMQALERLQNLVNNPSEAREMRRKIKNSSKKELAQYDELRIIIEKEINAISSSLPRKIDGCRSFETTPIATLQLQAANA